MHNIIIKHLLESKLFEKDFTNCEFESKSWPIFKHRRKVKIKFTYLQDFVQKVDVS